MILGSPQAQLAEVEESYSKITDLVIKKQPERIAIKDVRLQNQKLKALLQLPNQDLRQVDLTRLRVLGDIYDQLGVEFDLAKENRTSKAEFLVKLRRIMQIKQRLIANQTSQVQASGIRPPQIMSNSLSSDSEGGVPKLARRGPGSKESSQNMYRVPSMPSESHLYAQTGNFGKKQSTSSRNNTQYNLNAFSSKRLKDQEVRDIVPQTLPPRLDDFPQINDRLATQISHIRNLPTPIDSSNRYKQPNTISPIHTLENLEPIRDAIQMLIPGDDVQTPISNLDVFKRFPKSSDQINTDYFPIPNVQPSNFVNQAKTSGSIKSYRSSRQEPYGMIQDPEAFIPHAEEDRYRQNIENLFKRADRIKKDQSFKNQFVSDRSRSKSKPKGDRSKMKSTRRVRDLWQKQQLINKLAAENVQLRKQLESNQGKLQESETKKQTFPAGTLEFQKYVISNQLLKQQNAEIYSKLKQLEQVLEELSKQNYMFKEYSHTVTNREHRKEEVVIQTQSNNRHSPIGLHTAMDRRVIGPSHPLIEVPAELGLLIDTRTSRQTFRQDFNQPQFHYNPDYQGPIGYLDNSQKSMRMHSVPSSEHILKSPLIPSMLPRDILIRNHEQKVSIPINIPQGGNLPNFNNTSRQEPHGSTASKYSQNEFPEAPQNYLRNPNGIMQTNNMNRPNNQNSQQNFYTANNVSVSGDLERRQVQLAQKTITHSDQQYDYKNPGNLIGDQSDHREYQDFPPMSNHNSSEDKMNLSSPLLPVLNKTNSVQRSFQTFKAFPNEDPKHNLSSNDNAAPIRFNRVNAPNNFQNNNRSVLVRNKVAFFKKSLVLIRDDLNYQLAFKRSQLNTQLDTVRIIFYVNNKQPYAQVSSFTYEYDQSMYSIRQGDKLVTIGPYSQSREELVIQCLDHRSDVSSIVCHLTVGDAEVDIVMPVFFFKFQSGPSPQSAAQDTTMTIQCDKQFSPQFLSTLVPLNHSNPDQYLQFMKGQKPYIGQCLLSIKNCQVGLKLQWTPGALRVTCPERWMNQLTWALSNCDT